MTPHPHAPGRAEEPHASVLPNVLRIRDDGTLFCADGREVREYLRAWASAAKVTEETPLTIMRRDGHERDREDAWLHRNLGC